MRGREEEDRALGTDGTRSDAGSKISAEDHRTRGHYLGNVGWRGKEKKKMKRRKGDSRFDRNRACHSGGDGFKYSLRKGKIGDALMENCYVRVPAREG